MITGDKWRQATTINLDCRINHLIVDLGTSCWFTTCELRMASKKQPADGFQCCRPDKDEAESNKNTKYVTRHNFCEALGEELLELWCLGRKLRFSLGDDYGYHTLIAALEQNRNMKEFFLSGILLARNQVWG